VVATLEQTFEDWIAQLSDVSTLPASAVQDRLFEVWGMLGEGESRREVERWLTETLNRHLYTSEDLVGRLRRLAELETVSSS
jgi:hypothetical protein